MTDVARVDKTRMRFWLDLALFVAFLLTLALQITGVKAHGWLGIGMSAAVVIHLA